MDLPGSPQRITAAERRDKIIELRRQFMSFADIGRELGISRQRAHALYVQTVKAIPAANLEVHRFEDQQLTDDAIADLLTIAQNHEQPRTSVEAWNSIRGWVEHHARILGMNAPVTVEVSDARRAEIRDVAARIARLAAARLGNVEPGGAGSAPGDASAGSGSPPPA